MRTKRKKILYVMFLLITVLMFLHSWRTYVNPPDKTDGYAKKHHNKIKKHKHHNYHVPQSAVSYYRAA